MAKSIFGGIAGIFTGLCCAGFPLVLAFLTGIGLGFLINDFILFPLLAISLGFMIYAIYYNKQKHLSVHPLYVAIISSLVLIAGIFLGSIIWIGIVGLFIATIWDYSLIKKNKGG